MCLWDCVRITAPVVVRRRFSTIRRPESHYAQPPCPVETPGQRDQRNAEAGVNQKHSKTEGNLNANEMKLIKAGTSKLNADELVARSKYVEDKMTGNANFPTPNPSIATVTAAREALQLATAQAKSRATADIAVRNALRVDLNELMVNLSRYVNNVSGGDVDKAVSSGFELAKRPEPSTHLDAPSKLEANVSKFAGSVDLVWKRVEDARMYQVYVTDGDPTDATKWRMVAVSSKTRVRVLDLEPGKFYSFRVTALGRIGEGPASDVVSGRAA